MNLEELRTVQNAERQTGDLQSLRESFYEEAGEYIASLKNERATAAEAAEDPFSAPEVSRLTDEIETAEEVVEAIYERRMGKLLTRASLAAADMSADEDGLTAEERELFFDLVDRIETNKTRVLNTLEGTPTDDAEDIAPEDPDPASPTSATDIASGAETETETETEPASDADTPTVSAADVMGGSSDDTRPDSTPDVDPAQRRPTDDGPTHPEGDAPPTPPADDPESRIKEPKPADRDDRRDVRMSDGGETVPDRTTVRITRDVGEIVGVDDREYDLSTDTVVQLPVENAVPLVERDAAEPLE